MDKYIYWQINKEETATCYMRSYNCDNIGRLRFYFLINTFCQSSDTVFINSFLFSDLFFKILSLGIIVFCTLSYIFMFYAEDSFYGIKSSVLLRIIIVLAMFDIDKNSLSWMLWDRYLPPFVQLFSIVSFSKTFPFFFRLKCAMHYTFHE